MKKKFANTVKRALATALCLLSVMSLAACSDVTSQLGIATDPPPTQAQTNEDGNTVYTGAYGGMFDDGKILDIRINMTESDKLSMFNTPDMEEYYHADVSIDGKSVSNVGFRTRGNVSYVSTTETERFSFKIHFGKFVENVTLNGLDELCLNNMAYDPSYIREYLTYMALAHLGAPAPLATFAKVYINDSYAGLYLAVEAVDDSFLERVYGASDGNLYKANRDSTLQSNDCATFELKSGDDAGLRNLKTMVSLLSDTEKLPNVLDISSVLKYTAVNAVIANEDSYIGEKARNYYFYESDGKMKMIPWDFNLAFGTDTSLRKDNYAIKLSFIDADVKAPYFGVEASSRPLVSNLLSQSVYYDEYMQYVNKLSEFMDELPAKCNSVKELIDEAVKNDSTSFYGYGMFEDEFEEGQSNSLISFIKARGTSIKSQLGK